MWTRLVTTGSAAWLGPHLPSRPLPIIPVRPTGFLQAQQDREGGRREVGNSSSREVWGGGGKGPISPHKFCPLGSKWSGSSDTWELCPLSGRCPCDSFCPLYRPMSWTAAVFPAPPPSCKYTQSLCEYNRFWGKTNVGCGCFAPNCNKNDWLLCLIRDLMSGSAQTGRERTRGAV